MKLLIVAGGVVTTFLVFYFSWLPNPDVGDVLPARGWISQWVNANGNSRTAVPFIFLGGLGELSLINQKNKPRRRAWLMLYVIGVVTVAEVGQLWLPRRNFDLWDIVYGGLGAIVGMFLVNSGFRKKHCSQR